MAEQNLYEILGAQPGCDQPTLRSKYRKLCQKYHPDKPEGDEERFKQIQHAYEVLSDPEKRKRYDSTGEHNEHVQQDPVTQIILAQFMKSIDMVMADNNGMGGIMQMMQAEQRFQGNVIDHAKQAIRTRNKELTDGIKQLNNKIMQLQKIDGKVVRNDGETNLFQGLLDQKIEAGKNHIESLTEEKQYNELALDELSHYSHDNAEIMIQAYTGQTTQAHPMSFWDTRG